MGIFDFWRRSEPTAAVPEVRPMAAVQQDSGVVITTSHELEQFLRSGQGGTFAGQTVTPDAAMRVAAVYGCVRIISGAVATLPLDIKRRVDDRTREDASDHPLWTLMRRRPNGWMKPATFRRMLQAHVLLRGNAYCLKVPGVRGVQSLLPLDPDRVEVNQLDDMSLAYTYRRKDGGQTTFPQDEIFHLMGLTLDGVRGVSVVSYAREAIGLSIATAKHGATFFKNGTQIGSTITHPRRVGLEGQEFLKASLEAYRGAENAHKTLILEEGAEFKPLGMSAEDAQFVETMKLSRGDIAMFFGVPPHMLGDTEKSTSWGTGIEQQSRGFVAYTLEDWLTGWEEAVNVDLIGDREPRLYARFNRSALVRGDLKTRWEAYTKALQWGVYSPNEIRALEDDNPREGGDAYYDPPNTAGRQEGSDDDDPQAA